MRTFDLVVIGTGSAARAAAFRCRSAGWEIAIIDSRPFGGTCALRGCDPKRVLMSAGEAVDWSRRLAGKGIEARVRIDWANLTTFKRSFTEPFPVKMEQEFEQKGIVAYHGTARFTGSDTLAVNEELLQARKFLIAAGARPATLGIAGEDRMINSDQFLELDALPQSIVLAGGGYIAFEFAHLAIRAGAEVTILHRGVKPLEKFDSDLVKRLVDKTREIGVKVHLGATVTEIEGEPGRFITHAGTKSGVKTFASASVIHAAGRVPALDDLNLEAAGVDYGPRGVRVNEYLQSVSNPAIYAAGDAADAGPPLTPVAGYEGSVVADNLLNGKHRKAEYDVVASVVFTIPPLASVGLQEAEARARELNFRSNLIDTSTWYSSRRVGESCSAAKILIEEGTERILGAHLLGPSAEDSINLFALAIRADISAQALKENLFAYPTLASDIGSLV